MTVQSRILSLKNSRPIHNRLYLVSFFTEKTPSITKEKHFKVLLIGDPNVGKTSFAQRYANDTFRGDYKGTVGVDFALKVLRVSGDTLVKLQLWDVAGEGSANFLNL